MQSNAGIAISAPVTTTTAGATSLITTLATVSDVTDKGAKPKPKKTTTINNIYVNGGGAVGVGMGVFLGVVVVVVVVGVLV